MLRFFCQFISKELSKDHRQYLQHKIKNSYNLQLRDLIAQLEHLNHYLDFFPKKDKNLQVKNNRLMLSGTKQFDKTELVSIIVHSLPKHHREHMVVRNILLFHQGIDFFHQHLPGLQSLGMEKKKANCGNKRPPNYNMKQKQG